MNALATALDRLAALDRGWQATLLGVLILLIIVFSL